VLKEDADALDAFRVANRAVAQALRKRLGIETRLAGTPFSLHSCSSISQELPTRTIPPAPR
jgi:hypothetical protein